MFVWRQQRPRQRLNNRGTNDEERRKGWKLCSGGGAVIGNSDFANATSVTHKWIEAHASVGRLTFVSIKMSVWLDVGVGMRPFRWVFCLFTRGDKFQLDFFRSLCFFCLAINDSLIQYNWNCVLCRRIIIKYSLRASTSRRVKQNVKCERSVNVVDSSGWLREQYFQANWYTLWLNNSVRHCPERASETCSCDEHVVHTRLMRMNFHIRKWIEARHSKDKVNGIYCVCACECASVLHSKRVFTKILSFNWTQWGCRSWHFAATQHCQRWRARAWSKFCTLKLQTILIPHDLRHIRWWKGLFVWRWLITFSWCPPSSDFGAPKMHASEIFFN